MQIEEPGLLDPYAHPQLVAPAAAKASVAPHMCPSASMHRTSSNTTGTLRERATAVAEAAASVTSIGFSAQDSALPAAAHCQVTLLRREIRIWQTPSQGNINVYLGSGICTVMSDMPCCVRARLAELCSSHCMQCDMFYCPFTQLLSYLNPNQEQTAPLTAA